MANANKLTLFIVIFMLMGILSGAAIHAYATPTTVSAWADNITLLTDLFLRLIKMVIAPLVFSTLTVGIMRLGETATIGRVGGKAMVWFITSSVLSILVGLVIVTFQHPGAGLNLAVPKEAVDTGLAVSGMSLKGFLSHTIPTSITEAMANNEILQIVVFSMFFGIAGASLGEKFNAPLVAALNVVSHIMLKVTGYVMYVAPLAIFAAISSVIASQGLGILERLVKFGCSRNIVSFVLPIGYSFNLVGSMVYCSFAAMFIAQAYNVPLSFSEITVMMLTLMLASKGIAGVPRSALVVLAATIPSFNIPVAGILLLMGIDHFLDMGRSAINVLGNGIATAMLSKNEGLLTDEEAQPDWEVEKAEA